MRPSKMRHAVARLREILGLSQKDLAALAECSPSTIQSIEMKRLNLSEDLAMTLADATNVDVGWLLAGDPGTPPLNVAGQPYEKSDYETAQSRRHFSKLPAVPGKNFFESYVQNTAKTAAMAYGQRLEAIVLKATAEGKFGLVVWHIEQALEKLEKRYGLDDDGASYEDGVKPS